MAVRKMCLLVLFYSITPSSKGDPIQCSLKCNYKCDVYVFIYVTYMYIYIYIHTCRKKAEEDCSS